MQEYKNIRYWFPYGLECRCDRKLKLTAPSQKYPLQLSSNRSGHEELAGARQTIPSYSDLTRSIFSSSTWFAAFFRTSKCDRQWEGSQEHLGYWLHSGEGKSLFVKRRKQHTPAPLWGACGLQHQYDALRSMLSFMQSSVSSLSLVLGLLPPVSSPPENDASARTIFLSALLSTFQVLSVIHTSSLLIS